MGVEVGGRRRLGKFVLGVGGGFVVKVFGELFGEFLEIVFGSGLVDTVEKI